MDKALENSEEHLLTSRYSNSSSQAHLIHRWRQTNISFSGMRVEVPPDDQTHIQVGQLILLENEQGIDRGKQSVGVIRRLIRHDTENLEAGIQFIQGTVSPAKIKAVILDAQAHTELQPALLLNRGENFPPAVFTPQMLYQPNREYAIETSQGDTQKIFSETLLETTRCYERFVYRLISLQD